MTEQRITTARLVIEGDDPLDLQRGLQSLQKSIDEHNKLARDQREDYKRDQSWQRNQTHQSLGRYDSSQRGHRSGRHQQEGSFGGAGSIVTNVRLDNALRDLIFPLEERLRLLQDESATRRERFDVEHFLYYSRFLAVMNDLKDEEETRKGILLNLQELRRKPFWTTSIAIWKGMKVLWQGVNLLWKGLFGVGDRRTTEEKLLQVNKDQLEFMRKGEVSSRHDGRLHRRIARIVREHGVVGGAFQAIASRVDQRREDARARGEDVKGRDLTEGLITLRGRESQQVHGSEIINVFSSLGNQVLDNFDLNMKVNDKVYEEVRVTNSQARTHHSFISDQVQWEREKERDRKEDQGRVIDLLNDHNDKAGQSIALIEQHTDKQASREDFLFKHNHRLIRRDRAETASRHNESVTVLDNIRASAQSQDRTLSRIRRSQVMQLAVMTSLHVIGTTLKLMSTRLGMIATVGFVIYSWLKGGALGKWVATGVEWVWDKIKLGFRSMVSFLWDQAKEKLMKPLANAITEGIRGALPSWLTKREQQSPSERSSSRREGRTTPDYTQSQFGRAVPSPSQRTMNARSRSSIDYGQFEDSEVEPASSRAARRRESRLQARNQSEDSMVDKDPIEIKSDPVTNQLLGEIRNILNIMKDQYDPVPGGFDKGTQLNLLGE